MNEITFKLDDTYIRPVVNFEHSQALLDTGSLIPMFCFTKGILELMYNAKLQKADVPIGGIGGTVKGDLYRLYDFKFGDITYTTLDIFRPKSEKDPNETVRIGPTPITFSSTMFYDLDYRMSQKNKTFKIYLNDPADRFQRLTIDWIKNRYFPVINGVLYQDLKETESDINYLQLLQKCAKEQQRLLNNNIQR